MGRYAQSAQAGWPSYHSGLHAEAARLWDRGTKQVDQLYTRPMLEKAFIGFEDMVFTEEELEMHEGAAHSGISAVIGLTCQKPR